MRSSPPGVMTHFMHWKHIECPALPLAPLAALQAVTVAATESLPSKSTGIG